MATEIHPTTCYQPGLNWPAPALQPGDYQQFVTTTETGSIVSVTVRRDGFLRLMQTNASGKLTIDTGLTADETYVAYVDRLIDSGFRLLGEISVPDMTLTAEDADALNRMASALRKGGVPNGTAVNQLNRVAAKISYLVDNR